MRECPGLGGWVEMAALVLTLAALGACGAAKVDGDAGNGGGHCPPCDPNATCEDTTCVCAPGWQGNGESCSDLDECLTDNGDCDVNAACSNTEGGRDCTCHPGFIGDGVTCR